MAYRTSYAQKQQKMGVNADTANEAAAVKSQAAAERSQQMALQQAASGAGGTQTAANNQYTANINGIMDTLSQKGPYVSQYSDQLKGLYGQIVNAEPYKSPYEEQIKGLYDSLLNRPKFEYDVGKDPLYQQYRDQYIRGGQQAMRDTVGSSAALTGGYGNSWGQTAGYQAYQNYLQALNDKVPELRQAAYSQYQQEGDDLRQRLSTALAMDESEYGRYQDAMDTLRQNYNAAYNADQSDWQRYMQEVQALQDQAKFNADMRATDYQMGLLSPAAGEGYDLGALIEALQAAGLTGTDALALALADTVAEGGGGGGGGSGSGFNKNEYLASLYGIKNGLLSKNTSPLATLKTQDAVSQYYTDIYGRMAQEDAAKKSSGSTAASKSKAGGTKSGATATATGQTGSGNIWGGLGSGSAGSGTGGSKSSTGGADTDFNKLLQMFK